LVVYSRSTRTDLCELFSYPEENCTIIPLGVDAEFFGRKTPERPFPHPYFFSNGMIQPRKNFTALAKAFLAAVEEVELPHRLLIAGGDGWKAEEIKAEIRAFDKENRVHFMGYVTRQKLAALYQYCDAFLFPSLYEGFGLPVLEAMAAGTPVLTSSTSALPEVAGDAALLVNPNEETAIKEGILRLAADRELSDRYRQKGKKRASEFSFAQTAQKTADLIAGLLGAGTTVSKTQRGNL
jgi:glycosyltransferase involved in cell wall biosynthesis